MRYLTIFESFGNSKSEKMYDIKDICLELEDDGFSTKIEEHDKSTNYLLDIGQGLDGWYSLVIQKDGKSPGSNMWRRSEFSTNDVSDTIHHLEGYLGESILSIYILVIHDGKYRWMISTLDKVVYTDIKCKSIEIKFELG